MDGFNIYSDLVSQNIAEQNEAINKVQEEILEKTNSLQSRAEKAVEEIGSGVLLKEGLSRAISYVGSRIGGTAGKIVSDAASDYAEGGSNKLIQGLATKGIQAAKNLATKALTEDAGDDVIQMEPLGELQTPIEGSANPTFVGENADVEDELTGFGEEAGEGAEVAPEFVPPSSSAIQAAADLEDGLSDEVSTSMFDNVAQGSEDAIQAVSEAGEDAAAAVSSAASSAVEDASGAVSSAISAVGSGIEDAGIAATSALSDAAAAAAAAASGAVSGVSAAAAGGVATALEAGGAALDATGVGAIAGVVLGIGGVLASVFAPGMNETQDIPPLPNFSYQIGV